jgi:hypothetical protein
VFLKKILVRLLGTRFEARNRGLNQEIEFMNIVSRIVPGTFSFETH